VASGGLDHKICLWDLNGKGKRLEIDVADKANSAKASVYALSVNETIMASGGPESIVRVWDPRSGRRVTSFMGHTDNVRDVLINDSGDTIITASSDQTVKVWSVTAGRCMYTLTMHTDSVWALYSDHPQLSIFYSSDRSGLVAKTDVRGTVEMDEGFCVAVCQEQGGVNKLISSGDHIWTATSSSSINCWADVDTALNASSSPSPRPPQSYRMSSAASHRRTASKSQSSSQIPTMANVPKQVPPKAILRLSIHAIYPTLSVRGGTEGGMGSTLSVHTRKGSEVQIEEDDGSVVPVHALPAHTIEGQHGLIKHHILSDRRRVLTLDTAGEVVMWDLIKVIIYPIVDIYRGLEVDPDYDSARRHDPLARDIWRM
jgi:WD repeat-containing protein 48